MSAHIWPATTIPVRMRRETGNRPDTPCSYGEIPDLVKPGLPAGRAGWYWTHFETFDGQVRLRCR
jgi:hypothetical protein